jgi:hypothetical protein
VQSVTGVVNAYSSLPGPVQSVALGVAAVGAAALLAGGAFLLAVPKIAAFKVALDDLQLAGKGFIGITGAIGIAIAGITIGLAFWSQRAAEAAATTQALTSTLDQQTGALTGASQAWVIHKLSESGAFDMANQLGISQSTLTSAVLQGGSAYDAVRAKIDQYTGSQGIAYTMGNLFSGHLFTLNGDLDSLRGSVDNAQAAWQNEAAANAQAASTAAVSQQALSGLSGQARSATTDIQGLADTIRGFASGELSARDAARQFESAIDAASDAVKQNGNTLNVDTAAGRANEAALDGIAKGALNSASAIMAQTGSQEQASAAIRRGRDALIAQLGTFGITGAAADAYADKLGLIPDNVKTAITANTGQADAALSGTKSRLDGIQSKTITVTAVMRQSGIGDIDNNPATPYAAGGIIPGTPSRRDNRLIAAATGEFIVNTRQTEKNRRALDYINSGGVIQGFASGGMVLDRARYVNAPPVQYMPAGPAGGSSGGTFVGNLFLDSGEFLGRVRGEVQAGLDAADAEHDRILRGGVVL